MHQISGVVLSVPLMRCLTLPLINDPTEWDGKHFLWGVFHSLRKPEKHASQVDEAHGFHVEWDRISDIDMEIDMVAGEEVGRMDVAVPRESVQLVPLTPDIIPASSEGCSDMEIDMIGGEDVGRIDVAVSREAILFPVPLGVDANDSKEKCIDIPPGFENILRPIKFEAIQVPVQLAVDVTDSREAYIDIPTGFENIFRPIKFERSDDSDGQDIGTMLPKNHASDTISKPTVTKRSNAGCLLQSPLNAKSFP